MRFVELLAFILLQTILVFSLNSSITGCGKINQKKEEKRNAFESERFISESFRASCEGKGFESLVDWQKVCKAMWHLEYISWTKADSFMVVENPDKGQLLYGKWIGPYGNGEVYARVK